MRPQHSDPAIAVLQAKLQDHLDSCERRYEELKEAGRAIASAADQSRARLHAKVDGLADQISKDREATLAALHAREVVRDEEARKEREARRALMRKIIGIAATAAAAMFVAIFTK